MTTTPAAPRTATSSDNLTGARPSTGRIPTVGSHGAPRRVWTRKALLTKVWGNEWAMDEHLVEVHIGNLRKKLSENVNQPRWIETVRGVGYRLTAG